MTELAISLEPIPRHDRSARDAGFTLIEMLIVILIMGVLGAVAAVSVVGITTEAAGTGCQADRHQLHVAAEAYVAQTGADQIPSTGTGNDRVEQTLVDGGFLRSSSTYHDIDANGIVTPQENSPC
jgi:prepilin-type N-terminal cleavage/methylation domain-containing protein